MSVRPPDSRTLFLLVQEQASRFADRLAVIDGNRQITYRELASAARRVAAGLQERGIGRGDRVGLLIDNRCEFLEAAIGAAATGATVVPFSTWSKQPELDYLFADSEIAAVIAVSGFAGQDFAATLRALVPEAGAADPGAWRSPSYPQLRTIVMLGEPSERGWLSFEKLADTSGQPATDRAGLEDDCFILYTSGSSARPKAVRLQHRGTIENGYHIGECMRLTPDDRVLLAPPLFWAYGAVNALPATLTHGATLVLQRRFEPGPWIELIETHRCTAVYTLPSMTGAALREAAFRRERVASLRTGLMIGSPEEVRIAAEELGAADICNIYGSTETYGNCAVTPCDWPLDMRMQSQGPPLPGVTIRIVDPETGRALPSGEIGAVEVKGYITPGYCGASAVHNDAAFTADGYFQTGDFGLLDGAGYFHFAGRGSEMIKRAGINVSPAEVEGLLLQYEGVAQAAVVGVPAGERGEAIVAFVVPAPGFALEEAALRVHCRELASAYKVPDRFEICAALPVTETGKVFRRALKERAAAGTGVRT